ncbi:MAG: response regulator [Candidatus Omnitrophota bacterium]|nr:response regulator [Candidatus Omnitrophota bacterium]
MAKRKILLVDDEVDFLELMRARLEANGYAVITANNGKEALERYKNDKPSALLLDVMMPEIDGLSVLKQIRAQDAVIPIFIVTAFSNEERVKAAGKLNATGFIVKTQDLSKEVRHITEAIEIAEKVKEKRG